MLCLDLSRRLYESKPVYGIQVICAHRAVEICMLPHHYWLSGSWPWHHTMASNVAAACIIIAQYFLFIF